MKNQNHFKALLFCALMTLGYMVNAQTKKTDSTTVKTDSIITPEYLREVVIKSTRLDLKKKLVPQKIDIITAQQLERTTGNDLADQIKKNSAIEIVQRPSLQSFVSIRGFRPPALAGSINPETSIFIDGRPSGTTNLSLISPASIERVEVLKGPAAATYGSSAMGGIINIITKKSNGSIKGSVYGEYGSFETSQFGLSLGGNLTDKLDFNLSANSFDRSEDFKLGSGNLFRDILNGDEVTLTLDDGTQVTETDERNDGERSPNTEIGYYSTSLRLGYKISEKWRIDGSIDNFVAKGIQTAEDLTFGDAQLSEADRLRYSADIGVIGKITDNQELRVKIYTSEETNNFFDLTDGFRENGVPIPTFLSSNRVSGWKGVQLQDIISINDNVKLTVGADYTLAETSSDRFDQDIEDDGSRTITQIAPFSPDYQVETIAPFVQGYFNLFNDKLIVNPGFRYDFIKYSLIKDEYFPDLERLEENNTFASPSLGLQYNINSNLALHGNVGRAFRTARSFEIAGNFEDDRPGNMVRLTRGNPELGNEKSVSFDAGIKYSSNIKGLIFDLTYYNTLVSDRIRRFNDSDRVGEVLTDGRIIERFTTYKNADDSEISGLEAEVSYDFGAKYDYDYSLRVFANSNIIIKAEDITKESGEPDLVEDINNVADLTLGYGVEYAPASSWLFRLQGRYVGDRLDNDFSNLDADRRGSLIEYAPYMTLDAVVGYTYQEKHRLTLKIDNLTDENYYEKRGFNLPGRYIGLRYTYLF